MRRPAGGGYSFNVRAYLCKSLNQNRSFGCDDAMLF
jgi:hypothetical protein